MNTIIVLVEGSSMNSNMIWLLIALVILIYGIKAIKDREFSLGIGRPPIFFLSLKENFAYVMGWALFICGAINLLVILIVSIRSDLSPTWLEVTGVGSLFVLAFTFCLALVLQSAISLGEWLRKRKPSEKLKKGKV
jgi:hypothetical protein